MKILIAVHGLQLGGTARIAADISRCWIQNGHEVSLVTRYDESTDHFGSHPQLRRVVLEHSGPIRSARKLFNTIRAFRREIRRADPQVVVVLGYTCGVLVGPAALWLPCRTVICEFGVPRLNPVRRLEWFRRITYRLFDAVTSEHEPVADWLRNHTWARRSVVIPKSVQWPLSAQEPELLTDIVCEPERKVILAAGRLDPVKGFDSLLRSAAVALDKRHEWDVVILGDGPCRRELELQVSALGLAGRVFLPGSAGNLGAWYQRASIFAVSSLQEGGPNTLIEALAYGVPAISFDCDEGPRIIIRNDVDGLLVTPGDENALADGLARLMDDPALRARMATRAIEARDRFSEANCMQSWDRLFQMMGIV